MKIALLAVFLIILNICLLKVQKNIKSLRTSREALIITDDPMAEIDLKHFCLNNGYLLKEVKNNQGGDEQFFLIKKGQ